MSAATLAGTAGHGAAWRRAGTRGGARAARPADRAGRAVPPAAALRGSHARRADRRTASRRPRRHRRRDPAGRGRVPPAPHAARAARRRHRLRDAALFSFLGLAAGATRAGPAAAVLRRSAHGSGRPRDRASRVPAGRVPAADGRRRPATRSRRSIRRPKACSRGDCARSRTSRSACSRGARSSTTCRAGVLDAFELPPLEAAVRYVHRPPPDADVAQLAEGRHPAQRRLAFEELLAHQLSLRLLRQAADHDRAWPLPRRHRPRPIAVWRGCRSA